MAPNVPFTKVESPSAPAATVSVAAGELGDELNKPRKQIKVRNVRKGKFDPVKRWNRLLNGIRRSPNTIKPSPTDGVVEALNSDENEPILDGNALIKAKKRLAKEHLAKEILSKKFFEKKRFAKKCNDARRLADEKRLFAEAVPDEDTTSNVDSLQRVFVLEDTPVDDTFVEDSNDDEGFGPLGDPFSKNWIVARIWAREKRRADRAAAKALRKSRV